MSELQQCMGALGALRDSLALYRDHGVELSSTALVVTIGVMTDAIDAFESEQKDFYFDRLIRAGSDLLEKMQPVAVGIDPGCEEDLTAMGGQIVPFRRRVRALAFSPSTGGDAA